MAVLDGVDEGMGAVGAVGEVGFVLDSNLVRQGESVLIAVLWGRVSLKRIFFAMVVEMLLP